MALAVQPTPLLPDSQGVQFTARPALRTRENITSRNGRASSLGSHSDNGVMTPNGSLSSIEIEALLREKVRANHQNIMQAFMTYDVDHNSGVTKGEFRRVLESFCLPLTSEQFEAVMAKVDKNPNGTIKYPDFMDKFYGQNTKMAQPERWSGFQRMVPPASAKEINVDMLEKMIKEKVSQNLKSVVKALQLFDYNMDGKIQRHELRRVLENYCFKFSDQQYEKLWNRYDFHHTGTVNYKEFLQRLGISVSQRAKPNTDGTKGALMWPPQQSNANNNRMVVADRQQQEDEVKLQKLNFDQIEAIFRGRMKQNYLNLKKIFITFDRHLDGFIAIEDLKSILTHFTIPMSDQLFKQIMDRCGVRGTGKISWESFLDRFQDPQSSGNGQTIPIKPAHRFFPIREGMKTVETDDIWKLLYKHVHNHYRSLKEAFLQFDISRKGKVTRKELRKIIEKFTFRLDEDQFKQLMLKLDPYHTNSISYLEFLNLFEETDGPEGHKWLNSVHRFNDKPKPAIMAWDTVEDIMREKIVENWKSVSSALLNYDTSGEGRLSPAKLKKVLDTYVLPTSDSHFDHMLVRCSDQSNGKVNYVEFLEKMNVDVRPGDLKGLSTQIFDGSNDRESIRQGDQFTRQARMHQISGQRTDSMSADEVIMRLKDRMAQHKPQIRKTFVAFDKSGKGRVTRKNFREILLSYGIVMSDEQFNELTTKLGFRKGYLLYSDFVIAFEDPRFGGPTEDVERENNHKVNPIRGEYEMSADEVEKKLRSKLRENFTNLRGAFYKFDDDHNGLITKENFRRILDSFMCIMSDNEFEEFCKRMGISERTRISYEEFLNRFEVRDTAEGHKWLNSCHRFNEVNPAKEITAEEAFKLLAEKSHRQWKDISKAFISLDQKSTGVITKRDLRELLFRFVLPMGPEQFKRLWAMYDDKGKGSITHKEFLDKLAAAEFTPADMTGTSTKIIDNSRRFIDDHNETQLFKHQLMTLHQAQRVAFMPAEEVERQLRDKIRDKYQDFYSAFRKYDIKKKGSLSLNDVQKVLVDLNLFMNDEEFFRLLDKIGLTTNRSRLNYEEFLRAFEDGRKSSYGHRKEDVIIEEHQGLKPTEAENRLRETVGAQADVMRRALGAFDKKQTNHISLADFRRILDIFAFKLTEPQWKHLVSKLQINPENQVNYKMFLDTYTMSGQEDAEKWLQSIQKSIRAQEPSLMAVDEVQERIREAVHSQFYTLARLFAEMDYASIGVVSREDFKEALNKNVIRLSDEQFETVMASVPTNEFGNVEYKKFLKRYSDDEMDLTGIVPPTPQPRPVSTMPLRRPNSRATPGMAQRSLSQLEFDRPGTRMSRPPSRLIATPLINAEGIEQRLKNTIYRNWKDIQKHCRIYDKDGTGTINIRELRDILLRFGEDMPEEEFYDLMTKYDIKDNGTFSYVDFLRHFVLSLKARDDGNLMTRRKLPRTSRSMTPAGQVSSHFYDAMLRLRECVLQNWKEMRRDFRGIDETGRGVIDSLDFRKVLKQYNVNLSEEEFFHLMSYYDKDINGMISYNEFLRAYLQTS